MKRLFLLAIISALLLAGCITAPQGENNTTPESTPTATPSRPAASATPNPPEIISDTNLVECGYLKMTLMEPDANHTCYSERLATCSRTKAWVEVAGVTVEREIKGIADGECIIEATVTADTLWDGAALGLKDTCSVPLRKGSYTFHQNERMDYCTKNAQGPHEINDYFIVN